MSDDYYDDEDDIPEPADPGEAWTSTAARFLTEDRTWSADANCHGADPRMFFPTNIESRDTDVNDQAKAVCAGCTVKVECLDYALTHNIDFGTWGGLTRRERIIYVFTQRRSVA